MGGPRHFDEEIQEALDGRLDPAAHALLESHLKECSSCRASFEALRWTKRRTTSLRGAEPPDALAPAIASALDREVQRRAPQRSMRPLLPWALGGIAAGLLAAVWLFRGPDLPASVAADYLRYASGRLPLGLETGDGARLEQFFVDSGVPFPARVLDLGMMRYRLVGGRRHAIGPKASTFLVYRGDDGQVVVCQMYLGRLRDLPPSDETRENAGIAFRVYHRETLTLAFWQEGDVVCVLVGAGQPEALIQLAFAKAMNVSQGS